jgi:2-polyprenyl-3-methyl-5-hydroxy-6-metoxy-1,4-benzoquinol methylase
MTTPREVASIAASIFTEGPLVMRLLQRWRVAICPLDAVVDEVPRGSRVLDVGCGGGLLLGVLHQTGRLREGVGFDVSAPAIEVAQRMAARVRSGDRAAAPPLLEFHRCRAEDDWPSGAFDVVTIVDVLHHVDPARQRAFFERAASRVRPGGLLVYKDMAPRPRWRAWANRLHDLVMARQWIHEVDARDAESWARACGFAVSRAERINRLWYAHDLRVFTKSV